MFWPLLRPWALMSVSFFYLILTTLHLLLKRDLPTLLSWDRFNDAWFGNFWTWMGPRSKVDAERWVAPLLQGRVQNGEIFDEGKPIEGVVMEVGAGSGMWTQIFADVVRKSETMGKGVRKIYGVEPNTISAKALRQRVAEVGLEKTYEVLPVGIEDLQREADIQPGSVDVLVTVHCLCSIPEPEKNVRMLYQYLKPGGRWYVYEHVRAEGDGLVPVFQRTYPRFDQQAYANVVMVRVY